MGEGRSGSVGLEGCCEVRRVVGSLGEEVVGLVCVVMWWT